MSGTRSYTQSFSGGELTPEFWGHIGDAKYQSGVATMRNFIALPHGPAANRGGTQFVRATKDSGAKQSRLIPFTYSTTQTMVIELGAGYFRFHTNGATLLSGGVPYEVTNTYAEADLFDIHYVQSADVLTFTHANYAPMELRRLGATSWTFVAISLTSPLAAPTGVSAAASSGSGSTSYQYVVTATGSGDTRTYESAPSSSASCSNNLLTTGNSNTVTWSSVTGAGGYRVYKYSNGLFGYIGTATGNSFIDNNITADVSKTPPIINNPFPGAGDYPGAVSYFEQRRCFAGTINKPQNLWMTRSGTESDMSYSFPTQDSDSIIFRVSAREANTIRHIVPMNSLLLLTSSAEWRVTSINTDAITPTSVSVKPQSYVGASNTQPVIINNNVLYVAARGGHMREMAYNWQANGFVTGDLSLRAPHLFDGFDITDLCYAKAPYPIAWAVSTSGKLLSLTYVPEQQVGAWAQHDTDGVFESATIVAEGAEDILYVIVRRVVNGTTVRYVERMSSRAYTTQANAFFVDAGLTYSGTPATVFSGLSHLEGKTVSILADGAVMPQQAVTSGQITLSQSASIVSIGLPITADLQTLPLAAQIDPGYAQGKPKNVNAVYLRVYRAGGIFAGSDAAHLTEYKQRTTEVYGSPPNLVSEEIKIVVPPAWQTGAQVLVRHTDPLPMTIVSMTVDVMIGG